ncbi:hypothetical protein SpiGrapes_0039 [Sphaerochaeta pleomorpha str. Grapes]|uniref:Heavy-metal chelation domain-containing protein n=1 Tax=Sphaerochaeta pleomorpha (strain ATCC BAA-1885 / DSM 22778 / Grapes) TaxID=158190 RepID=G8QSZ8_SPHPG|nr:DUF364 domain-containing protein [Sphaerochaeta pleomorpha]AEV27903.1 hypothetical protein SpiGrapes_0039 [Sphaerochaeta pleomorpha str. Grapes]
MDVNQQIFDFFAPEAKNSVIDEIHLGLGYSAITLTDGRCGLCCTFLEHASSCSVNKNPLDYEQQNALMLLQEILSDNLLDRTMAIALVNALNASFAAVCPDDPKTLEKDLHLAKGSKVAMVGYFEPIVRQLGKNGIEVVAYDIGKKIGSEKEFYCWAKNHAEALILTATSVITNSTESVFEHLEGKEIPTVLMGPSTIMQPKIYKDLPISMLSGTVPVDLPNTLKAIRNGRGTPVLHKYARTIRLLLG